MTGVEIDFIVKDSVEALQFYKEIFDIAVIEATSFPKGQNEAVFSIYGTQFHMLDENPEFQMLAPKEGDPKPIWFNITVEDIKLTYEKAIKMGCKEVQPVTEFESHGVRNAMFTDRFGYLWMLHQVHRVVGFEERVKAMEEQSKTE